MDLHLGTRDAGCSSNTQEQHHDQNAAKKQFLIALLSSSSSSSYELDLEHMFDKVVTPSDVGKLNRLVIPKQSAEKYFPLKPSAEAADKGTQLTFEDPTGRPWRFRYSYWKSSRSYVMTRGWSSFVREKRLKTGDTVSFWGRRDKCRPCHWPPHPLPSSSASIHPTSNLRSSTFRSFGPLPNARVRVCSCGDDTGVVKQLRLFGVNIERFEPAKCEEAPEVGINNVEASLAFASAENWVS